MSNFILDSNQDEQADRDYWSEPPVASGDNTEQPQDAPSPIEGNGIVWAMAEIKRRLGV